MEQGSFSIWFHILSNVHQMFLCIYSSRTSCSPTTICRICEFTFCCTFMEQFPILKCYCFELVRLGRAIMQ
jgi:hypothetical protein